MLRKAGAGSIAMCLALTLRARPARGENQAHTLRAILVGVIIIKQYNLNCQRAEPILLIMKKTKLFAIFIILILLLTACGANGATTVPEAPLHS